MQMLKYFVFFQGNTKLVEFVVSQGGAISDVTNQDGRNILHLMAEQCIVSNLVPLLKVIHVSTCKLVYLKNVFITIIFTSYCYPHLVLGVIVSGTEIRC